VCTHGSGVMLRTVADTAQRYGQSPASITYRQVDQRVSGLIAAYRALGLPPRIRVALALDNRPEFFYHWLALNALGISVAPLNPYWRSGELEYVLRHSDSQLAVGLPDRIQQLQAAAPSPCPVLSADGSWTLQGQDSAPRPAPNRTDECALLYTSGTTGRPKGCLLDNSYFLNCGTWYAELGGYCALNPGRDRLITPLPMYHMNALATSTMAMLMSGGCIVPLDRFHPRSWWNSVRESNATIMHYLGVMPAILRNQPRSSADRAHREQERLAGEILDREERHHHQSGLPTQLQISAVAMDRADRPRPVTQQRIGV